MRILSHHDIHKMERIARLTLINSLTGFKSGNLIGTQNQNGVTNLAIFSSAVHLGSEPPLIGIVTRPIVPDGKTSRHTYDNIKNTGFFTLNHINLAMIEKAHQTSASYPDGISEFEAVGLTPQYLGLKNVPYVLESSIKMGLEYVEEYVIKANQTIMIIGKVLELILPENCLDERGNVDLNLAQTVAVSGLDTYHSTQKVLRLPYARAKKD
ncbi:MAG: flavin reductase [Saprospiraceae bacterium]|nr:flavin reductase [Saprospiraceae bacterium]